MPTPEQMSEDLELIEEARAEYLERISVLQSLQGEAFDTAASELTAWVDEVNEDLNDAAREILGDELAVDAESLEMLRLARVASTPDAAAAIEKLARLDASALADALEQAARR